MMDVSIKGTVAVVRLMVGLSSGRVMPPRGDCIAGAAFAGAGESIWSLAKLGRAGVDAGGLVVAGWGVGLDSSRPEGGGMGDFDVIFGMMNPQTKSNHWDPGRSRL